MDQVVVVMPSADEPMVIADIVSQDPVITATASPLTPVVTPVLSMGIPGPQGPGIASNIKRITASTLPPSNPEVNDLWIDLS